MQTVVIHNSPFDKFVEKNHILVIIITLLKCVKLYFVILDISQSRHVCACITVILQNF